jgi:hypothetical protein
MASFVLVLAAAVAADHSGGERPLHEFAQQISALFKEESQAKNPAARAAVVARMCALHGEMVADPRFATSDVLKEYRGRLWSRLTKIKAELKQHLARQRGHESQLQDAAALAAAGALEVAATASLSESLALLDQTQGGPGRWMAFGGGPGPPDWGPDLVALIERTINPAFWDVVGGPGTIVYYRPLQCLVVRATAEVHGRVGGLVDNLRAAGP